MYQISGHKSVKSSVIELISRHYIVIGEQATVVIGENVTIRGEGALWIIREKAKLEISDNSFFFTGSISLEEEALMMIGKEFYIGPGYRLVGNRNTSIIVGDDCMFSKDVIMRSNDAHTIFDIETGKNINSTCDIRKGRNITIGNHVWIGERAYILYGTQIGGGSVIGAMSFVKSKIPNNCIAAGVPARVIRKNIAWSREDGAEDVMECGKGNINYTE